VEPRFKTSSPLSLLTPPGRVLNPWTSQGRLEKAGTWSIWGPWDARMVQDADARWTERRLAEFEFVVGMTR